MNHRSIRKECCEANRKLHASGLADLTIGNVSVIDRSGGIFAIKPSGVSCADLILENIVIVDLEGNVVEGELPIYSDTMTHLRLFLAFSAIGAVIHSCSRHSVGFAQALRPIPCLSVTHADYFRGAIPVTRQMRPGEIHGDYEWEIGNLIAETFSGRSYEDVPAVLVAGQSSFVWGVTAFKALESAMALENCAELAFKALMLNPAVESLPEYLLEKHFLRSQG